MCGIVGYFSPDRPVASLAALLALKGAVRHRGPDGEGCVAIDSHSGRVRELRGPGPAADPGAAFPHDVGLGHTRFAIVDLSEAAHQPFWSDDRQQVLCFNGEIYNHPELREELEKRGRRFRTSSDTEVLLACYAEWGLECFERLNGFWALALYDLRRRRLVLARDRIGRAPLYTAALGGTLYWASEIKALRAVCGSGAFPPREEAIRDFVQHGWRDVDHGTFYEGIRSLDNASYAVLDRDASLAPQRFWQLPGTRLAEREIPFPAACRELRRLLDDSLRLRERADVPLAMELSGGMDSSSLVALRAARGEGAPLAAYTVRFDEPGTDESHYARALVARFPGRIEHHLIRPPRLEFWEHAHEFVAQVDEPFHAPNALTSQGVRRRIRRDGFKVVVTGSAGDELLAGYDDVRIPFLRDLVRRGRLGAACRELAAARGRLGLLGRALGPERSPAGPACAGALIRDADAPGRRPPRGFDALMRGNFGSWKLNQWLRVSDAFQYAIPLESRLPFLDHRVVELAFRLPSTYLIRGGWSKFVLRRALEDLLPASVAWRPRKMGYPFPLREWLRASKQVLLRQVQGVEPPGLRADRLAAHYDALALTHPRWLWRFASVVLWHRRCNLGLPIAPQGG